MSGEAASSTRLEAGAGAGGGPRNARGLQGFAWDDGRLLRARVVECALGRVCGGCGRPLGRPIAFVGDADERARNAFHLPPLHVACAATLQRQPGAPGELVTTAGFEFVRPTRDDPDPEPRFVPNSLL